MTGAVITVTDCAPLIGWTPVLEKPYVPENGLEPMALDGTERAYEYDVLVAPVGTTPFDMACFSSASGAGV